MGSVGDNFKCPLCGRVGNGGYALDGVGFPVCTEGEFSCLWFQLVDTGLTVTDVRVAALSRVFCNRRLFRGAYNPVCAMIVRTIFGDD